jgi:hypothetical protein
MQDRLRRYLSGKAAVSGLGAAALDRALADSAWLAQMVHRTETEGPLRAKQWAKAAIVRDDLELAWIVTADGVGVATLEKRLISASTHQLWSRRI